MIFLNKFVLYVRLYISFIGHIHINTYNEWIKDTYICYMLNSSNTNSFRGSSERPSTPSTQQKKERECVYQMDSGVLAMASPQIDSDEPDETVIDLQISYWKEKCVLKCWRSAFSHSIISTQNNRSIYV